MLLVDAASPPTFLEDYEVLADVIRLFIIITGVILCMIAAKVSLRAFYYRDFERAFGTLAFALVIVTPSISGIYRFGEPLVLWTTITYVSGLVAGVIAMYFRVTLRWAWWRRSAARRRRRWAALRARLRR